MATGLETIHRLKKEHESLSKDIAKREKEVRRMKSSEPLYETAYAEKKLVRMKGQLVTLERKMVESWVE